MIKVKVKGTDEKVVLEGTVGTTVRVREVSDYWMDGGYAGCHYEADYVDFSSDNLRVVVLDAWNDAECDCSEETFNKWFEEVRRPAIIRDALENHHRECAEIGKGKKVMVVRGRKVAIGTTGRVFWTGTVNYDPYGRSWCSELRVGFKDEEGNVYWTSASNCEVIDVEENYRDADIIEMVNSRIDSLSLLERI